jgi:hypothetical protein
MKEFIKKILTGLNGEASSKRFIGIVAFIQVSLAFNANIFWDIPIKEYVFDGMIALVFGSMGLSVVEYFSNIGKKK